MNTVQSVKLQTKVKTKSKSLGRVGIIISIFILALSGSWYMDGFMLKELSIGCFIFGAILFFHETSTNKPFETLKK